MEGQCTNHLLMVRPAAFGYNPDTAASNAFQHHSDLPADWREIVLEEFHNAVNILRSNGIQVAVIQDNTVPAKPDAIFPNNWFSTHAEGFLCTYPMSTPSRRAERRVPVIAHILKQFGYTKHLHFEFWEEKGRFLEGTGSLVLDRVHSKAYACLSPRTDKEALRSWAEQTGFRAICFEAYDQDGVPLYHTNVLMSIGDRFVVICLEAITDANRIREELEGDGKIIVEINFDQMTQFAGNILQVQGESGSFRIIMSSAAFHAFSVDQRQQLEQFGQLVQVPIPTIEWIGGGSLRCMVAELFDVKKMSV